MSERDVYCYPDMKVAYEDGEVVAKDCPIGDYPQPCNHYASVIAMNPGMYNNIPCFTTSPAIQNHRIGDWYGQHRPWTDLAVRQNDGLPCNADEWPPAYLWTGNTGAVWIRYCDGGQNQRAGQIWNRFCPKTAKRNTFKNPEDRSTRHQGRRQYVTATWLVASRPQSRQALTIVRQHGDLHPQNIPTRCPRCRGAVRRRAEQLSTAQPR